MKENNPILKTVFLDRDGVINQDSPEYIKSPEEFHFIPGSVEAVAQLTQNGFDIILITNQSAINRRMISTQTLDEIFLKMKKGIMNIGGEIKDIFYCPHMPEDQCDCRKPRPGLILKAQKKHRIDLSKAIMVGDSTKDIECAKNADCGYSALVRTGNGVKAEKILKEKGIVPNFTGTDLLDVTKWILENFISSPETNKQLL